MKEKKYGQARTQMLTNTERFKSFKNHPADSSSSTVKKVGFSNKYTVGI